MAQNPVQAALAKELADLAAAGADMTPLQAAIAALPPAAPALSVSPSGAYIDNIGPILVDKFGNTWQIVAGNRGNDNPEQMLALNGATVPSGAVILGLIFDGIFYQENNDPQQTPANKWWSAPAANGAFVAVPGDPRIAPAGPAATPAATAAPSSGVPAYLNANGFTFTKKTYEYIPSAGPLANLDIAFDQSPGHAWYPYPWWAPTSEGLSASNFNFDPSDGALVITPGPQGTATIESFQNIAVGGTGIINGNGFLGTHAFEIDWHPNNGSGYWSMSKNHVSDNVTPVASNPLTLISEMDFVESCSGTSSIVAEAAARQMVPTTLHRNTGAGEGIADTNNQGNMTAPPAKFFATMPNGQPFDGQRHVFAGMHIKGTGFWLFVDGVLVNEFTGANYYDSAAQDFAMFIDYAGNYMLNTSNNPDPAELRIYRHTIWT
jgi:hypothetical protein